MQKNIWNRKFEWSRSGLTSPYYYYQQDRSELYDEKKVISVGDIYFKLNKYLTGVTFTYITSLYDIYNMENLLTGDGYSLVNMYNEYDVIDRAMKNIVIADIAADTNINIDYQWFEINGVKILPGHLVLLKNQNNQSENDVYIVDSQYFLNNAGLLSTKDKSDKFSCSIKLGKNADKQFFLSNNGSSFPTSFEPKIFIEGKSYILKNLIQYNLLNDRTESGFTSKMIFTDYEFARTQLSDNFSRYNETSITGITKLNTPANYVTLNYHHDSYSIRSGTSTGGMLTGKTYNITNSGITGITYTSIPYVNFDCNIGDYIYLNIYSGISFSSGFSHFEFKTFIKDIQNNFIILEDIIPNYILIDLKNCDFFIENLNVATNWDDALEKMKDYTPYSEFYSLSAFTWTSFGSEFIDIFLNPKENIYDKYFDYNGLTFDFTDSYYRNIFYTTNPYLKYNLYDRLSEINVSGFTSGFTFFNDQIISGVSLNSYQYTDDNRIKITTSITGLTSIFKSYTYVYASAIGEITEKTLVYSVNDHEIILEKPNSWTTYPSQAQLPQLTSIQNVDGLKNISDILYEVYINKSFDWYIKKTDNERKYINKSYAELLTLNDFFRKNVTGILYENDNNEFLLKLYDIENDQNLTQFEAIELIFIGADRKSRLPVPLKLIDKTVSGYTYTFWNILIGGLDDSLSGPIIGEIFNSGQDNVLPGLNDPPLLYTLIVGGLDSI